MNENLISAHNRGVGFYIKGEYMFGRKKKEKNSTKATETQATTQNSSNKLESCETKNCTSSCGSKGCAAKATNSTKACGSRSSTKNCSTKACGSRSTKAEKQLMIEE